MSLAQSSAVQRFCRLPTPSYEKIFADANTILDDIISHCHTYRRQNQDLNGEEIVNFVTHGCTMLANASILLKSKFAQVVNVYLPLMKSAIDEHCVNHLVFFLCQSLQNVKSLLVSEFMKALALTLTGNGVYLNDDNIVLLLGEEGVIWSYLEQSDWTLKSYAIQCLGNLCLRSLHVGMISKQNVQLCYSKLLDTLRMLLFDDSNEIEHFKLINVALKALQKVLSGASMHDGVVEPEFAVVFIKIFLVYGCPGYRVIVNRSKATLPSRRSDDLEVMEKIYPTKKKEKSTMTKKVNARKSRKKKKKNMNTNMDDAYEAVVEADPYASGGFVSNWRQQNVSSSSESEFSDSEMNQVEQLDSVMTKIRYNCAVTLQEILRCCDRRSRFACWLTLLPDNVDSDEPSLLQSFVTETSTKIKSAVLLVIMELADGAKGFLDSVMTVPQNNNASNTLVKSRSFIPFSVKLNQSLHLLHQKFIHAIEKEESNLLREKTIKCVTLVMLNTPYKKLGEDYLPVIMKLVSTSLFSAEHTLCQSSLTCLAACMSIDANNTVIQNMLSSTVFPSQQKEQQHNDKGSSWLVIHCLQQLNNAAKDSIRELRLAAEYIQLVTVMLRNHPQLIAKQQMDEVMSLCMKAFMFSSDISISFHSIKLLEEFSKYYNRLFDSTQEDVDGATFWRKAFCGAIPHYLHNESVKPIKGQAAICDWISNIGSHMFDKLKNSYQIFLKTVLIGLTDSEEPLLAAAAVRALGAIIGYNAMKEDVWFVVDATRAILKQLDNAAISVRLKAAWALANLCDFIAKNDFLGNEYPQDLTLNLLQDATKAALHNEKISPNGVRAIGNLLKSFNAKLFENEKFVAPIKESIEALIKNISSGQMKTRWNACYACRYIFENKSCPIGRAEWTGPLFLALLEALRDCKNFKVRISAAVALLSVNSRHCYGDAVIFATIWKDTIAALEKSEELTDFTEFKHKENLQEQTTILLLHLLSLAKRDDVMSFQKEVKHNEELFVAHCTKCLNKVERNHGDNQAFHLPDAHAGFDDYIGEQKQPSEDEVQKIQIIEDLIDRIKENLKDIKTIPADRPMIDVIRNVLGIGT